MANASKTCCHRPLEAICVDLIGPYTLKEKDGKHIDFVCVTMIDPATSWFDIVELQVSEHSLMGTPSGTEGHAGNHAQSATRPYFDKKHQPQ